MYGNPSHHRQHSCCCSSTVKLDSFWWEHSNKSCVMTTWLDTYWRHLTFRHRNVKVSCSCGETCSETGTRPQLLRQLGQCTCAHAWSVCQGVLTQDDVPSLGLKCYCLVAGTVVFRLMENLLPIPLDIPGSNLARCAHHETACAVTQKSRDTAIPCVPGRDG